MSEFATAIHEAGHAVIARALGLSCGAATILPNEDEGEAGHAEIDDPWRTAFDWEHRGRYRDCRLAFRGRILASMAGAEGETVLLGRCAVGDGFDRTEIAELADSADTKFTDAEWQRREPRMRAMCRMLVWRHRAAIAQVASALVQRGSLTGPEIDEIWTAAPSRRFPSASQS